MDPTAIMTAVANGALVNHLGQPPITSIDQDSNAARTVKAIFAGVRDDCLVEHDWNFAKHKFTPAATSLTADAEGWYYHPLPDNCLQVLSVAGLEENDWEVVAPANPDGSSSSQARLLAARSRAPRVTATWRIENAGLWSPKFRNYLQVKLAEALAPAIARDQNLAEGLEAKGERRLMKAKRRDGQEGARKDVRRDTSWIASRRRGSRP